jgi:diguanylate cyclase (GGDEF)-like protein
VVEGGKLMDGAAYLLAVNLLVALSFSAVFVVVAQRSQSRSSALWIAAGFGVASLSAVCELLVAYSPTPKPWALGAFAAVLCGMVMLAIGIAKLYGRSIARPIVVAFISVSLVVAYLIYDLPRGTWVHAFLYQSPFAVVVLTSAGIVLFNRGRSGIDGFLGALLLVTGLHFFAKAGLAVLVGSGSTAADYIHTGYALISQSSTAVLMVAVGLTLLATLILEIMVVQRTESELDILSGLANRRGFDRRVHAFFAQTRPDPHAFILCDLDHFKQINDTYGHQLGDLVIQTVGERIRTSVPHGAIAGRLGGEEFAIFLPNTKVDAAVQFAQKLRSEVMSLPGLPHSLTVTASFGVASLTSKSELTEAYRRADQALYNAKDGGRNRVKIASNG